MAACNTESLWRGWCIEAEGRESVDGQQEGIRCFNWSILSLILSLLLFSMALCDNLRCCSLSSAVDKPIEEDLDPRDDFNLVMVIFDVEVVGVGYNAIGEIACGCDKGE